MRLLDLRAVAHPAGGRIDLSWRLPEGATATGVRVVRRVGTYPVAPDSATLVADLLTADATGVTDDGLDPGTVYYYMLFPFQGAPATYDIDRHNRVSALATTPQDYAGYLYDLLPVIYRRYDTATPIDPPPEMSAADRLRGPLRRFLDLPGGELDRLHSFATAVRDLHDVDRAPGDLLPLLAGWIGWSTDFKLEFDAQRNEIRNAPAIYKSVGLIPTVEATVKRSSGWESTTKEYVHNVLRSNRPPQLNLWSRQRDSGGVWAPESTLLSVDSAFEGRPAAATDADGIRWLFYHTERKGRWHIWAKSSPTARLELGLLGELVAGPVSPALQSGFVATGFELTLDGIVSGTDSPWRITDATAGETYVVEAYRDHLLAYRTSAEIGDMAPSLPAVGQAEIEKYPSAALHDGAMWLFWSTFDEAAGAWSTHYRTRAAGQWSPVDEAPESGPFAVGGIVDDGPARKRPAAVTDETGALWLFWLESAGDGWQLRYNRRTAGVWGVAVALPLDGTDEPRVETDLQVVVEPAVPNPRIWVFWSRQARSAAGDRSYSELVYRVKTGLALDDLGWSAVQALPRSPADATYHDREPAALIDGTGAVELFWSSNREDQGWSVWHSRPLDVATNSWEAPERITDGPYAGRDPLPLLFGDTTLLIHRSNQPILHQSTVYRASESRDARYAGSVAVDTRNLAKSSLRGGFEDFGTYTHDLGPDGVRGNDDRYARDTIGVFLTPDTTDDDELDQGIERLSSVLREFMPVTDRAVFVTPRDLRTERVYTYGLPPAPTSRRISETHEDTLNAAPLEMAALAPGEDFTDGLES